MVFDISASSFRLEVRTEPCPQIWRDNIISNDARSGTVGTTPKSTELCIQGGVCAIGDPPLKINNHTSGDELGNVTVQLLDIYGAAAYKQGGQKVRLVANTSKGESLLLLGNLEASLR